MNILKENASLAYGDLVSAKIRRQYSQDRVEALTSNYIADKETYQQEWDNFQAYRELCKQEARQELELLTDN